MVSTEFLLLQPVLQFRHRSRNPFRSVPRELPDPDPNPQSKYRSGSRSGCNYIIIMKKGQENTFEYVHFHVFQFFSSEENKLPHSFKLIEKIKMITNS
jgi:hypothetical protein